MSTYVHFECLDHPGGLISEGEFTQHVGDRHFLRGVQLISQRPVERDDRYWSISPLTTDAERSDLYFEMQARAFLNVHPTCRIGIIDEYGDRRDEQGNVIPPADDLSELIEAAVRDITPNVTNETHAWNLWNALSTSAAFITAFETLRRQGPRMEDT